MTIVTSFTVPAQGTKAVFDWLTFLTANGWHVKRWSDGTTDSGLVDLAVNPYGSDGAGAGNLGNTNAWFRVQIGSGATLREWMPQRGANDQTWAWWRSKLGFTTGGSGAVIPTDATSGHNPWASAAFFAAPPGDLAMAINTADGTFNLFCIPVGGGNVKTILRDRRMATGTYPTTPVADADPYDWCTYYNSTGLTAMGGTCFVPYKTSTPLAVYKRFRHGLASAANLQVGYEVYYDTGTSQMAPPGSTTNQVAPDPENTHEWPLFIPVCRFGVTGVDTGWCGYLDGDGWSSVGGRANGQTLHAGSNYWIYMAGVWTPWDSSTPTL